MDYKKLNDNELVYMCAESNEDAVNILIDKYKSVIMSILNEFLSEYNIIGVEVNDLYQEGLIGFIHAIDTFNKERDVTFYTYACACIKTSIISAMRQTFRKKNRILNNSYSLDKLIIDEEGKEFYELFNDPNADPDFILFKEENTREIIDTLNSVLSKTEKEIFELRLMGFGNIEIADKLNKSRKYVENAIFRINKKYKDNIKSTSNS